MTFTLFSQAIAITGKAARSVFSTPTVTEEKETTQQVQRSIFQNGAYITVLACLFYDGVPEVYVKAGTFNPIKDGPFWATQGWGDKKIPLPKICHTYPAMMKLGTVILT